jgi:hypothetical protein
MKRKNGVTLSKDWLRSKQTESNFPCEQGKVSRMFKQVAKFSQVDFDFINCAVKAAKASRNVIYIRDA